MQLGFSRIKSMFIALAGVSVLATMPTFVGGVAAHPSQGGGAPGAPVHAASCEQAPPQSVKDRATYTPTELDRYGLPQRAPNEPFEKWARIVRNQQVRHCDYSVATGRDRDTAEPNSTWSGYIGDQSTSGQSYTEIDLDYYVPCVVAPYDTTSDESQWIGLGGGALRPGDNTPRSGTLLQTGSEVVWNGGSPTYWMWWEDYNNDLPNTKHYLFTVGCGGAAHMYVKVWNGTCIYVQRLNDGYAQGNGCAARRAENLTAEVIVERFATLPALADFNQVTFYGVGVTDNGQYRPMGTDSLYGLPGVPHNHAEMRGAYIDKNGEHLTDRVLSSPLGISDNPGDTPYDKFTIYWWSAGP